jgi:hypothetical protein
MMELPHVSNPFAHIKRCGARTRKATECKSPAMKNGRYSNRRTLIKMLYQTNLDGQ